MGERAIEAAGEREPPLEDRCVLVREEIGIRDEAHGTTVSAVEVVGHALGSGAEVAVDRPLVVAIGAERLNGRQRVPEQARHPRELRVVRLASRRDEGPRLTHSALERRAVNEALDEAVGVLHVELARDQGERRTLAGLDDRGVRGGRAQLGEGLRPHPPSCLRARRSRPRGAPTRPIEPRSPQCRARSADGRRRRAQLPRGRARRRAPPGDTARQGADDGRRMTSAERRGRASRPQRDGSAARRRNWAGRPHAGRRPSARARSARNPRRGRSPRSRPRDSSRSRDGLPARRQTPSARRAARGRSRHRRGRAGLAPPPA